MTVGWFGLTKWVRVSDLRQIDTVANQLLGFSARNECALLR